MTPEATSQIGLDDLARRIHVTPGDRRYEYPVLAGSVPAIPMGLGRIWGTGGSALGIKRKEMKDMPSTTTRCIQELVQIIRIFIVIPCYIS